MTNTNISSVIIGVDTHKSIHVAVAIDNNGSRLMAFSAPATTKGYKTLEDWACALGTIFWPGVIKLSRSPDLIGSCAISMAKAIASTLKAPHDQCWPDKRSPNPKRKRDP